MICSQAISACDDVLLRHEGLFLAGSPPGGGTFLPSDRLIPGHGVCFGNRVHDSW